MQHDAKSAPDAGRDPAFEPVIRVVRGTLTPEELAALTAVLLGRPRPAAPPAPVARPRSTARWQGPEAFRAPGDWTAF
ncbi:acyl-CoA carboxylase subunit epsilon [Streptomyces sp. NPDC102360]|uniref:acyl-CoA carboxylase subunit epsilon n=1 Tax=Streptomyces sp. NPDC102360 TaxID=3366160 RepID=UPI00382BD556